MGCRFRFTAYLWAAGKGHDLCTAALPNTRTEGEETTLFTRVDASAQPFRPVCSEAATGKRNTIEDGPSLKIESKKQ